QARAGVARGLGAARPAAEAPGRAPPAPEQFLEEVAEAAARATSGEDLLEVEAFLSAAAVPEPARRGPDLVAGAVAARAQLVVGLALGRIAQRLVGLVDLLEALLGVRFLADVGMVFARQPAIGGLDLGLAGARLDAEDRVVVLELHGTPVPCRNAGPLSQPRGAWVLTPFSGRRRLHWAAARDQRQERDHEHQGRRPLAGSHAAAHPRRRRERRHPRAVRQPQGGDLRGARGVHPDLLG